jgi:hypothetical protein
VSFYSILLLNWCMLSETAPAPSPLILQIRVVEGDGAAYPAGSRAVRGLTVEVTDEAGQPVPNAAVSFRLPESGPSGVFANGTRTEIASSSANGRATVWGMKWNRLPGSFAIRVTVAKGETRAGAIVPQSLLEPSSIQPQSAGQRDFARFKVRRGKRWVWLSALAAGAAGGGLAFGSRSGGRAGPSAAAGVNVNIGNPSISVGRPQ